MDNKKVTKPKPEKKRKSKPQRAAKPKQEKKKSSKTSKTLGNKKTLKKKNNLKFENGDLELDEESYSKKVNTLVSKIKNKYLIDSDDSENKIRLGWK